MNLHMKPIAPQVTKVTQTKPLTEPVGQRILAMAPALGVDLGREKSWENWLPLLPH